jgi:hypothetical protein
MTKPTTSLLPPVSELSQLTPDAVQLVIESFNAEHRREHSYAILGMLCGTFSFLGCVASFTLLVMNGHPGAAGVILGTGVLAIIGRMLGARL